MKNNPKHFTSFFPLCIGILICCLAVWLIGCTRQIPQIQQIQQPASSSTRTTTTTTSSSTTTTTKILPTSLGVAEGDVLVLVAVSPTEIYAGGRFTSIDGVPAKHLAKWDGTAWSEIGGGVNGVVNALVLSAGSTWSLYVGGEFTTAGGNPAYFIARWDGSTWNDLGGGMDGIVLSLVEAGSLYAGGSFASAGGNPVNGVAKWDGSVWTAVGALDATVTKLAASPSGGLYAAIVDANGDSYIVHENALSTSGWSTLGGSFTDPADPEFQGINTLAVGPSGEVYAGGKFTKVGITSANRIAKWTGSAWSDLGGGPPLPSSDWIYALATSSLGNLYAGNFYWNGSTWEVLRGKMDEGRPEKAMALAFDRSGSNLYTARKTILRWGPGVR